LFNNYKIKGSEKLLDSKYLFNKLLKRDFVTGATVMIHRNLIPKILPLKIFFNNLFKGNWSFNAKKMFFIFIENIFLKQKKLLTSKC
jgi:hypothetical protein